MLNTSPTLVTELLSTAERNIPVPSTSGCIAGLDKIEKIRAAGASMSRDSETEGWVMAVTPFQAMIWYERTTQFVETLLAKKGPNVRIDGPPCL
jgi:hypothetical protein